MPWVDFLVPASFIKPPVDFFLMKLIYIKEGEKEANAMNGDVFINLSSPIINTVKPTTGHPWIIQPNIPAFELMEPWNGFSHRYGWF